uniref:Uncharacterized protein n=1 Tax=candidate division WOR-3 bacterium TaxID=2052148 RepID=A0A7C4CDJ2_UNCW3
MAKTAEQRVNNWNAKFDPGRAMAALATRRRQMLQRYAAAVVTLCAVEQEVKQVLNAAGVPTIDCVWYLDYGRELFRLSRRRKLAGASLTLAAQVLLDKWQRRGLDTEVLARIRAQVFNIVAPES